jgi:sulfoxide reductase catalytic subunit YedY
MKPWQTIDPAEITPEPLYRNRRAIMRAAGGGVLAAVGLAAAACGPEEGVMGPGSMTQIYAGAGEPPKDTPNTIEAISGYNNYYEFTTDKEGVARLAKNFKTSPWTVAVGGMVNKPQSFSVEDLIQKFPPEERIYRLRCVEGWSMVIPWQGFPLHKLLEEVEPTTEAKFVRFQTVSRPDEMPGQKDRFYPWPYTEGLRLDEAMNDLTLLVTGLYGKALPPQNGAPLRVVVPWKYGFKSVKAIVTIDLVDKAPTTLWMAASPNEYGFYANVNPDVPHPRWSQSTERRIGEVARRKTLPFNGYADQVASMYAGMDLRKNF